MATQRTFRAYVVIAFFLPLVPAAPAQYSGGSGTAADPYRIATAADLIALGETPADYDKHFLLTANIDLHPKLPGRKVFDKAVIGPDWQTPFTGSFDGNGHAISHLTIRGERFLGLFGALRSTASISNLGLEAVDVSGTGDYVGGLVGVNRGASISASHSSGSVSGGHDVGGLVGWNYWSGRISTSYSTGSVSGDWYVGGLVGSNASYESWDTGAVSRCYSTGVVMGTHNVGGLVGRGSPDQVSASVWDMETSGQSGSAGAVSLTTAEMMDPEMLGLNGFADDPNWVLDAGRDYPRLAWEGTLGETIAEPEIDWLEGQGTQDRPYEIATADQLVRLGKASILWNGHFVLVADIDLDPALSGRYVFGQAVIQVLGGVVDGNGHTISHLTIEGCGYLGLLGQLD